MQMKWRALRKLLTAALAPALVSTAIAGSIGTATASPGVEYLMVPSAAMGCDIPVAFQAGGRHAVYLLDAFNAAPDVSNWVRAGNGMNALAGKGIPVVAPAGGAFSMYTDWEGDSGKQWETYLSSELPDWLAAMLGYPDQAQGSNWVFKAHYETITGQNAHFDFLTGSDHGRSSWGPELAAMSGDLAGNIR